MPKKSRTTKKTESTNPQSAAQEPGPAKPKGSHGDKRILSIAIDPGLHSRLALLARCEGKSVPELVVESVSKNLKARITAALESLRAEVE
jgi:hypothetical protein